jgi:hypothetical protein
MVDDPFFDIYVGRLKFLVILLRTLILRGQPPRVIGTGKSLARVFANCDAVRAYSFAPRGLFLCYFLAFSKK